MRHVGSLAALALCAAVALMPGRAAAAPVEYVRLCPNITGFFYVPALNTCFNVLTGETLRNDPGTPFSSLPSVTPGDWARSPSAACKGRLQLIGTFRPANLTLNSALNVYETPAVPFRLAAREFISGLFLSGRFARPATGFCIAMRDALNRFAVLGCRDLSLMADTPATWRMIPRFSAPPAEAVSPVSFVGGNYDQPWSGPATSGAVTLSACIDKAS